MTETDLLDPTVQRQLRGVLDDQDFPELHAIGDEAVAALAFVGRHPQRLRSAALALTQAAARAELFAYRLADRDPSGQEAWRLTPVGTNLAESLARKVPALTAAQQADVDDAYEKMLAEVDRRIAGNFEGIRQRSEP